MARNCEMTQDAFRFAAVKRCVALYGGCLIIAYEGNLGETVIGVPVESICYSTIATGSDVQTAIDDMIAKDELCGPPVSGPGAETELR